MKILLIISVILLYTNVSFSQLKSGFNSQEAKEMIMLCNSFTYAEMGNDESEIIPKGYTRTYDSPVHGMDNKFQIYTNGKIGVINFRGSTDAKSSWLENFYSAMIPVEGTVQVKDKTFDYKFGEGSKSGVHSGYTLGLAYLHEDLLKQLKVLNEKGIYNILITGHSQGGALAMLTRAYLEHAPKKDVSSKNRYKVYVFAQPMVGNIEFIREYNALFCKSEMSYSMINPDDFVPNMPMSYNDTTYLKSGITDAISRDKKLDMSKMVKDGLVRMFRTPLSSLSSTFGRSVSRQIERELGDVTLPKPTGDINYAQCGNVILLPPPVYPLELKDSSILENKKFLKEHPRDENGIFENKAVYKKTSMSLNHKPYNYYTAILKVYFSEEFNAVEPKYFGL